MKSVANLDLERRLSGVREQPAVARDVREDPAQTPDVRILMLGWLRLAVAALLSTGIFVLLVAIARTPLVEFIAGRSYLYTALVAHVIFALDVWLLSFVALLWVLAGVRLGGPFPFQPAGLGMALAWIGAVLLAVIPLAGLGQPVMNDYVPILVHPLFFLGLGAFFGGIAVAAFGYLIAVRRRRAALPPEALALSVSAVAYLVALVVAAITLVRWGTADYATVVWGPGHLFQVVNVAGLIAVWLTFVPVTGRLSKGLVRASFAGFVPSIGAVALVAVSSVHWESIATIFWAGIAIPLVISWLVVASGFLRRLRLGRLQLRDAAFLVFSLVLVGVGGLIALPGMGSDTRVTAHYHATVGAVTMIFMGLTYRLLPSLGVEVGWRRLSRLQPYLYGGGLLLLVGGLFWAGEAGTARKIFQAMSNDPSLIPATVLFVLGALTTVFGGVVFVIGVGLGLLGEPATTGAGGREPVELTAAGRLSSRS